MATKKKTAKSESTEPTADEREAVESFQPVVLDVNSAHESLARLNAEWKHTIDTNSPGMTGDQVRALHLKYVMLEHQLGDSIAPVNEVTQPATDPVTGEPINPDVIPEPAEASQATSDQT